MAQNTPQSPAAIDISLPDPLPWPAVACTPAELARLRAAYADTGLSHQVVARQVAAAEKALEHEVAFPPEGGQHNQWYQCDRCQIALETVDDTHHRCPTCSEVYTGYPYDNVIYSRRHSRLTRDLAACAWASALTGEDRFARRARDILVGYAERYEEYPYHSANMGKRTDEPSRSGGHVFEQTLNESSWMAPVCTAYDLVRTSEALSMADHAAIRDGLLKPVYESIAANRAGKSNWQTYHNSAFLLIGGVLGDEDMVRQAICDPENGFLYQMEVSVLPGGMWYENSWSYHFYTLGAIESILETARRLGIDLYSTPGVRDMYTVALDYRMPDQTLPRLGDAVTGGIQVSRYESAHHAWRDPAMLALLPQDPTWDSVLYGRTEIPVASPEARSSLLKQAAGHGILRADGPEGPASAVLTFGPFGGFHGHFDKLSFVFFAMGRELGYDPGRSASQAYRLPVHRNWYRATTSHNTVLVDGVSQEGAAGEAELFLDAPGLAAVAAHTAEAYPGVDHHRLLVLRPGFLLVVDLLRAPDGRAHRYDWLYHNRGEGVSSPQAQDEGEVPEGQGFEYLQDVRRGQSADHVEATFSCGEGRVQATVDDSGGEVLIGTGVGESVRDRVPLLIVRRTGTEALFAVILDPTRAGAEPEVARVTATGDGAGGCVVRVTLAGGAEEVYAYSPEGSQREAEGVSTAARLLCLRREPGKAMEKVAEAMPVTVQ